MMSAYNMTIANPAMAPKGGGMAGLPPPLDPPLICGHKSVQVQFYSVLNCILAVVLKVTKTYLVEFYCMVMAGNRIGQKTRAEFGRLVSIAISTDGERYLKHNSRSLQRYTTSK